MEIKELKSGIKINDLVLSKILERLCHSFAPERIFLFGSRAQGSVNPDSDYDIFLIVKNSHLSPEKRKQEVCKILWGTPAPADVFVYTIDEFDAWKNEFNSIPHTVNSEGLELKVG